MAYATLSDLVDRAGEAEVLQVADRDGDAIADAAVIAASLAAADQRIDAALGVRFALPLSATPPIVISWAVSIARYHLHRDGAPDYVVRDYRDALADLDKAARGLLALPIAGIEPVKAAADGVLFEGSPPTFGADSLGGWQ